MPFVPKHSVPGQTEEESRKSQLTQVFLEDCRENRGGSRFCVTFFVCRACGYVTLSIQKQFVSIVSSFKYVVCSTQLPLLGS